MEKLAQAYNIFQNAVGENIPSDCDSQIQSLFSTNFKKIANGSELVKGAHELESQLRATKEFAGGWTVDVIEFIASACNKRCTIRYILKSEKAGNFDVIAIITSDDQKKIDIIDEVYYQFS